MFRYTASGLFDANDFKDINIDKNYLLLFFSLANEEDNIRRQAAHDLAMLIRTGKIQTGEAADVLCVPSWHSYSPFSPLMAAFIAKLKGFKSFCICDDCTLGALNEAKEASMIFDIPYSFAITMSAHAKNTAIEDKILNGKEKGSLVLAGVGVKEERAEDFEKDVVAPLKRNKTARIAAENWALKSTLPKSPVIPDFWNETFDNATFRSSYYDESSVAIGTIDQRHLFYSLASNILEGDFIAENICDVCDNIPYKQALTFEEEMPFKKIKLAKLLEDELYDSFRYSSFDDDELMSDTMPLSLMAIMLNNYTEKVVYPAKGHEDEEVFKYLSSVGISYVYFDKDLPCIEEKIKTAESAGLKVLTGDICFYLKDHII